MTSHPAADTPVKTFDVPSGHALKELVRLLARQAAREAVVSQQIINESAQHDHETGVEDQH